jgi:hypothetical protein
MKTATSICIVLLTATSALSQQLPAPEKFKNAQWYQMVMTKYKTESLGKAEAFIEKYFAPVDKELGRNVIKFHSPFGDYDEIAFFPIDNIEELNYKIPPSGAKWMDVFMKQNGKDQAIKLLQEFEGFIQHTKTSLVRKGQ